MEAPNRIRSRESVAQENIQALSKHGHRSSLHFRAVPIQLADGTTDYVIKTNSIARRLFYSLFSSRAMAEERREAVFRAMRQSVEILSALPPQTLVSETGEARRLFLDEQRFNQAVYAHQKDENSILSHFHGQIRNENLQIQKELLPVSARVDIPEVPAEDVADRPTRLRSGHLAYPMDIENHDAEATRIFLLTQLERLASVIFHIFTDRFDYFRGGVTEADIRTDMAPVRIGATNPSSYWVGHSTCLMSIPLINERNTETKTFTVLTDPVEGDLNAILYPRKTRPGRKIEEGPAVHAMLLSHNHLDHLSTGTVNKLLSTQPVMIVPQGDGHLFRDRGFTHVFEQNWWDRVDLTFHDANGEAYHMGITAVPSHHWAGQGPLGGTESAFVGHVISGAAGGDIYYAGDTARLNADHIAKLRQKFNIRWMFQPGGPDERRADMRSTHQASADSLWMHAELLLKKEYLKLSRGPTLTGPEKPVEREEFKRICTDRVKTILMHTSTFKLGNLHADDTIQSIDRVIKALDGNGESVASLTEYELEVLALLLGFCDETHFADTGSLMPRELSQILQETVYVPKIGSRIDFETDKATQRDRVQAPIRRRH